MRELRCVEPAPDTVIDTLNIINKDVIPMEDEFLYKDRASESNSIRFVLRLSR